MIGNEKILVIDDNNTIRQEIVQFLNIKGYQVVDLPDGQGALNIIKSKKPDLILVDLHMPVINGLDLSKKIKDQLIDIPIIIMSSSGEINEAVQALRIGVNDYLFKPFEDMNILYQSIKDTLNKENIIKEKKKQAEDEKNLLVTAIEQADEIVLITDTKTNIQYINPAFERITGYSRDEAIGKKFNFMDSSEQNDDFYNEMSKKLEKDNVWNGKLTNIKKDGTIYQEEATISTVFDSNGVITNYVAVKRDITNEINLEKELLQTQKMEALGKLAGGIAHDFNNILSTIKGNIQLAKNRTEITQTKLVRNLQRIENAAERATDLIQRIMIFSKPSENMKKVILIQDVIIEVINLLRGGLPSTIKIETYLNEKVYPVMADPTQIHQVIMNICTNAYQAIPDQRGKIVISLNKLRISRFMSKGYPQLKPGKYVEIIISDTGHGISKTIIEKVFDPYFTTKKSGEGTGMGLSTVHSIVYSHNGIIDIKSRQGIGTTFYIVLPACDKKIPKKEIIINYNENKSLSGGNESILLLDDEIAIVQTISEMLAKIGYKVTSFTDSTEAYNVFRKNYKKFDMIITDHTMPNMTGIEFAKNVSKIRHDIPIILCSGYAQLIDDNLIDQLPIMTYLKKPINHSNLICRVRDIFDNFEKNKRIL